MTAGLRDVKLRAAVEPVDFGMNESFECLSRVIPYVCNDYRMTNQGS